MFSSYIAKFSKSYKNKDEYNARFEAFKENYRKVQDHNSRNEASFKLGINKFSDLTNEEFK